MNRAIASPADQASGPVWTAQLFLLSLMVPFFLPLGTLVLMPHRIVLLVLFVPLMVRLLTRGAGPVLAVDWLMLGSALWAGVALFVNQTVIEAIEGSGIHLIEFFGGYLLARVAIRNAADFQKVIWTFFILILCLVPFAAIESLTGRAVLLEFLPGTSVRPVNAGIRLGLRRAQTIFAHPILFGVFVSTGLGLFWYVLRPRWLRYLAAPLVAVGTLFSLSTGALIAVVMQALFISWEVILRTVKSRWRLFAVLSVIGYFAIDILSNRSPFHVLVTYATFYQGSAYNRILIWQFGTENVLANPVFGLGFNDWVRPSWMRSSVDNFWLLLAMRYGIPTIGMILAALFIILRRVSRTVLEMPQDQRARAGYLVTFGGLFIAGGTVHYWHAMMAFSMFIFGSGVWIISGGAASGDASGDEESNRVVSPRSRFTRQTADGGPIGVQQSKSRKPIHAGSARSGAVTNTSLRLRRR